MSTAATGMKRYELYINGEWQEPDSGRYLPSINPATGQEIYLLARAGAGDVDRAVEAARSAFHRSDWRGMSSAGRGQILRNIAEVLRENADALAEIETRDNGKLIREMRVQHTMIPDFWTYFAGWTDKIHGYTVPVDDVTVNYVAREPVGVIAAIVAWNSPLLLATYKLAPALAAGNTVVLKPSEHATASALEFARLCTDAGLPPGVINVVTGLGPEVGDALVSHPDVDLVTFTGGTETGRSIAGRTAERPTKTLLELGGKSPQIIFPDADLDRAAAGVISGIFAAAGQTCVAGSRCFVHKDVYDDLLDRLVARTAAIRVGDPMLDETDVGPLAFRTHFERVLQHIENARTDGAKVTVGGSRAVGDGLENGYYVEPTILEGVSNRMRVAQEEIFGPVLSVIPFGSEGEVLEQANDSKFGLAAGVWTRDVSRAHRVAHHLDVGIVWVNTYRNQVPQSPIGGFKSSGYGKENGLEVMHEYTRLKSVWIDLSDISPADPLVMNPK